MKAAFTSGRNRVDGGEGWEELEMGQAEGRRAHRGKTGRGNKLTRLLKSPTKDKARTKLF